MAFACVSNVGLPADFDPAKLAVTTANLNLPVWATHVLKMKCSSSAAARVDHGQIGTDVLLSSAGASDAGGPDGRRHDQLHRRAVDA